MPKSASSTAAKWNVRGQSGYVALWHPEAVLEAAEKPLQGVLFPSELFWPEKGGGGGG